MAELFSWVPEEYGVKAEQSFDCMNPKDQKKTCPLPVIIKLVSSFPTILLARQSSVLVVGDLQAFDRRSCRQSSSYDTKRAFTKPAMNS